MLFDNLPTARQKKRKARKDFDRRLLAIDREYKKVWQQIRNLGFEDLEMPYQRGWKRSFVLRDDVWQSARAMFFKRILEKINTVQYSTRKDFKKKRRRRRRSGDIVRPQELRKPGLYEFQRMQFTEEEAHWFQAEEYWCPCSKCWRTQYVFRESWRFVLKTEPNMITKRAKHDWELERQRAELCRFLDAYPARSRLDWLHGGGYKWYKGWDESENECLPKNPFSNKQKEQVVREFFEIENITSENISFELFL